MSMWPGQKTSSMSGISDMARVELTFVNKEYVFVIYSNSVFMKLVTTRMGQGLMLCNVSIMNSRNVCSR